MSSETQSDNAAGAAPDIAELAGGMLLRGAEEGSGVPLYLQVARLIERNIGNGSYAIGSLLPTEVELASRLGISRQTVRQAIAQLRSQGLVSARKGVGTRVEAASVESRYRHSVQSLTDLIELARDTEMRITERTDVVARGRLATELGCRPGRRWVHFIGLRHRIGDATPLCWTEVYLDGRFAPIVHNIDVFHSAIFALVERQSGERIVEIEQEIRPIAIDSARAAMLLAEPGSLALQVTRRYLGSGRRIVQMAINLLPADRFLYSMTFRPESMTSAKRSQND